MNEMASNYTSIEGAPHDAIAALERPSCRASFDREVREQFSWGQFRMAQTARRSPGGLLKGSCAAGFAGRKSGVGTRSGTTGSRVIVGIMLGAALSSVFFDYFSWLHRLNSAVEDAAVASSFERAGRDFSPALALAKVTASARVRDAGASCGRFWAGMGWPSPDDGCQRFLVAVRGELVCSSDVRAMLSVQRARARWRWARGSRRARCTARRAGAGLSAGRRGLVEQRSLKDHWLERAGLFHLNALKRPHRGSRFWSREPPNAGNARAPSLSCAGCPAQAAHASTRQTTSRREPVLNHRVDLHAIDATPARWRGDAGSSPLDASQDGRVIAEKASSTRRPPTLYGAIVPQLEHAALRPQVPLPEGAVRRAAGGQAFPIEMD